MKRVAVGVGGAVGARSGRLGVRPVRGDVAARRRNDDRGAAAARRRSPACGCALVTDPHHGPYNRLDYIASAVDATNALAADLVAVGGDFAHGPHGRRSLAPCLRSWAG